MIPAKTIFGVSALAAMPILLALVYSGSNPRQGNDPAPSAQQGIISSAQAREPAASIVPAVPAAKEAVAPETPKRTVRVVLDSPFGLPSNVVVTTQPAKPPVYADVPPTSSPEAEPLLSADTSIDQPVKPRPKKPRKKPAELGALYYAPPQALPPPFFALR